MELNELKKYPFSGNDILDSVDGDTKIVKYSELHKYDTIDDVMYPHDNFTLLYETRPNYGHWTCIIRHKNGVLEFFDPYAYFIDDQLKFISDEYKKVSHQDYPFLSRLFFNSPYMISYNQVPLQKRNKEIATCGRHVASRLLLKNMNINDYVKLFKQNGDNKVLYLSVN